MNGTQRVWGWKLGHDVEKEQKTNTEGFSYCN